MNIGLNWLIKTLELLLILVSVDQYYFRLINGLIGQLMVFSIKLSANEWPYRLINGLIGQLIAFFRCRRCPLNFPYSSDALDRQALRLRGGLSFPNTWPLVSEDCQNSMCREMNMFDSHLNDRKHQQNNNWKQQGRISGVAHSWNFCSLRLCTMSRNLGPPWWLDFARFS